MLHSKVRTHGLTKYAKCTIFQVKLAVLYFELCIDAFRYLKAFLCRRWKCTTIRRYFVKSWSETESEWCFETPCSTAECTEWVVFIGQRVVEESTNAAMWICRLARMKSVRQSVRFRHDNSWAVTSNPVTGHTTNAHINTAQCTTLTMDEWMERMNESINQSMDEWINDQSIHSFIHSFIDHSIYEWMNESINQSMDRPMDRSIKDEWMNEWRRGQNTHLKSTKCRL